MPSTDPYWWRDAPPPTLPRQDLDPACDVAIVGAGYTGLSAAITLARAGRSVQVFDAMRPGEGASTRNGGITSGNLRPSAAALTRRFGGEQAAAILAEAKVARDDLYRFIAEEGIGCGFALTGRFTGAATAKDYERLARDAEALHRSLGIEAYAVPEAEQRRVMGTGFYRGGAVRMDIGGLHPAKLHAGMLRLVLAAGARVHGRTAVAAIRETGAGHEVRTARGVVRARDVITGTNGYTDAADRWLRRRLVPVRSRMLATAPLDPALLARLMPRRMMAGETRRLHYYYRPSPDGTRILFGGRDGAVRGDPPWAIEALRRAMVDIFPELDGVAVDASWWGHVAMNRDMVPRVFTRAGRRYAVGYCGSGVVWARWAGQKAALQVLGEGAGRTALDFRPPPAVPLFEGRPWFMPAVYAWMMLRDRLAR